MTRREFDKAVEAALAALPEQIRRAIDNLAIIVEDRPTYDDLDDAGLTPDDVLFGLFRGVPRNQRSFFDSGGFLPNQIILFKKELEDCCPDRTTLTREITLTLVHEVGHYLGLEEEELMELEREAVAST